LFVGVMKCKKCKCRRRTWLLTTGTPPGAKATLMAGSAGDIRLCMDTSSAWWQSARSWMTWPARVYVGVVVCMILCFCISAALLRTVFSCIVTVYALWCSRRLNLTAEIALASPHPPCCYAPRSHMHTGASAHATNQADAYTLGGAGKGEYLCHSVFLFCFHTSLVRSE
jgi:hypothetical protein